jgi:hypothetical protein
MLRRSTEAIRSLIRILNIAPDDVGTLTVKRLSHKSQGDLPRARALSLRSVRTPTTTLRCKHKFTKRSGAPPCTIYLSAKEYLPSLIQRWVILKANCALVRLAQEVRRPCQQPRESRSRLSELNLLLKEHGQYSSLDISRLPIWIGDKAAR